MYPDAAGCSSDDPGVHKYLYKLGPSWRPTGLNFLKNFLNGKICSSPLLIYGIKIASYLYDKSAREGMHIPKNLCFYHL